MIKKKVNDDVAEEEKQHINNDSQQLTDKDIQKQIQEMKEKNDKLELPCTENSWECLGKLLELYDNNKDLEKFNIMIMNMADKLYNESLEKNEAKMLKRVYIIVDKWAGKNLSKKQKGKVKHIKQILGEQ